MLDSGFGTDWMMLFAPPATLSLYSNLSAEECAQRLGRAIDAETTSFFALSGYRGSKKFLGDVTDGQVRIMKRLYRNSFPSVFTGALVGRTRGTEVKGDFDLELTSKIALCLFSLFGPIFITLMLLYSLRQHTVPDWVAIGGAVAYGVGALLAPRIVRWIGRDQERDIEDFLCVTLEAGQDRSAFESGTDS
jgi:hypothetical protein